MSRHHERAIFDGIKRHRQAVFDAERAYTAFLQKKIPLGAYVSWPHGDHVRRGRVVGFPGGGSGGEISVEGVTGAIYRIHSIFITRIELPEEANEQ